MDLQKSLPPLRLGPSRIKIILTLIFICITAFYLRYYFELLPSFRGWDETVYLNLSEQLSVDIYDYSFKNSGWTDFIPTEDKVYGFPNAGFRAPLLPLALSLLGRLGLDNLVPFFMPFLSTLAILAVYYLALRLFGQSAALISASLIAFTPIHVVFGGQYMTDPLVSFFVVLTFISFWRGYEEGNDCHKILFGLFMALSLLSRYTTLWILPVFLMYFLIRDRNINFLKDKKLWLSILVFFIILSPWLIFGYRVYGNLAGAFIHGFLASSYWGGVQSWFFFIQRSWHSFSITSLLFVPAIIYLFYKKQYRNNSVVLVLIWFFVFFAMVSYMPHKEERFMLPAMAPLVLIVSYFLSKLPVRRDLLMFLVMVPMILSVYGVMKDGYQEAHAGVNVCFREANYWIKDNTPEKSLIITNQSPISYYYTKRRNKAYPEKYIELISTVSSEENVYAIYSNYDMVSGDLLEKEISTKHSLVFHCQEDWGYADVYRIK